MHSLMTAASYILKTTCQWRSLVSAPHCPIHKAVFSLTGALCPVTVPHMKGQLTNEIYKSKRLKTIVCKGCDESKASNKH